MSDFQQAWYQFRANGLLWYINQQLQAMGYSIFYTLDEQGDIIDVRPKRTRFRGFSEASNDRGFGQLHTYLRSNIEDIAAETLQDNGSLTESDIVRAEEVEMVAFNEGHPECCNVGCDGSCAEEEV